MERNTLTDLEKDSIYIAGGFAHPELAGKIADYMGVQLGNVEERIHPNGEIYSRYGDSIRGKEVFIVQPHIGYDGRSVNDAIMQQCLLADAARSSSASEITAVSPYLGYSRQDRKARGREPIGVRSVIDMLAVNGVQRMVTVDMHSPQSQSTFRGPFDHLTGQRKLREAMREEIADCNQADCVVVAPDAGAAKLANKHREKLGVGLLHLIKYRDPHDTQKIHRDESIPEADGRVCMVFDDMIDTAGTLVTAAEALKHSGATKIFVAATHGVLSDPALERLQQAPIDRILITDTMHTSDAKQALGDKLRVVSIAPLIGEALVRIIQKSSVSDLFNEQNYM